MLGKTSTRKGYQIQLQLNFSYWLISCILGNILDKKKLAAKPLQFS